MKLANFVLPGTGEVRCGIAFGETVVDPRGRAAGAVLGGDVAGRLPRLVDDWLIAGEAGRELLARAEQLCRALVVAPDEGVFDADQLSFESPVLRPGKMIAVGRNYGGHLKEAEAVSATYGRTDDAPQLPTGFVKVASALTGHRCPIVVPEWLDMIDYEAEVVVVIGRRADNVPVSEALEYVAGFTIGNDVSARGLQAQERAAGGGVLVGKNRRTFAPVGPYLVTRDEVADPSCLHLWCTVNGTLRQDTLTSGMLFPVAQLVAWYSQIGLDPGDLIFTGTPDGIGAASGSYLVPGDVVRCGVDGLGVLENEVVRPAAGAGNLIGVHVSDLSHDGGET